ncbi:MAG: hypothetical protein IT183_09665 [Acidobacteria bacterium]|nr:hypothetical protein [Acidobacteriota bacterium]
MSTRLSAGLVAACCCLIASSGGAGIQSQSVTEALLSRLAALPHGTHNSEVRVDPVVGSSAVRVWINSNEDDMRLYTPAGGQMDMDVQVWALVRPGELPDSVSLLIETRGLVQPGPGTQALAIRVDGRPLSLAQRERPLARSGPLLFLSTQAELPLSEFLRMATSSDVDGRVWDVPFRVLEPQIELLRAWTRRVTDEARPR